MAILLQPTAASKVYASIAAFCKQWKYKRNQICIYLTFCDNSDVEGFFWKQQDGKLNPNPPYLCRYIFDQIRNTSIVVVIFLKKGEICFCAEVIHNELQA